MYSDNQQSCCVAELVLRSLVCLCIERRSKISVNKNDSNTDFPKHPDTHTYINTPPPKVRGLERGALAGGA